MKIKSLMALTGLLKTSVTRLLIVLLLQGGGIAYQ